MRFGTDITSIENTDGSHLVYVSNAPSLMVHMPKWFTREEKAAMLEAIKANYLKAARRVLEEEVLNKA